jgi:hypothetical protein
MPERQGMTTRLKTLFQRPALFVLVSIREQIESLESVMGLTLNPLNVCPFSSPHRIWGRYVDD